MENGKLAAQRWSGWRIVAWSIVPILLLMPLIAMQFTNEVNWTASDFVFAGVLFGIVGLAFEFIVRRSDLLAYRCGAALAVIASFLTVWINGAVGMIGSEDNPYNLIFIGVLFVALVGAILARLEPRGMMRATAVTTIAQAVAGGAGFATDIRGASFSILFAGLWLLAATFFRNAAQDENSRSAAL